MVTDITQLPPWVHSYTKGWGGREVLAPKGMADVLITKAGE